MNTWRFTVFGLVFVGLSLPIAFHLLTHPPLLWRRIRGGPLAEPEPRQRLIISLILLCVVALGLVCVLDYRLGWSQVPVFVMLLGDLVVAAGLVLIWLTLRVNPFAAAAVNVEPGQTVIPTGPYALVRHPMYSGGLLLFLGIALALGSWWGLVPGLAILALIIWRLTDEERYLSDHLSGYREYCAKVTHRLIPYVW
jgi:protein-S-isoprenylcysteine O-methyltransferase Ste14